MTDFYHSVEDAKLDQLYDDVGGRELGIDGENQVDTPKLFDRALVDEAHRIFDGSSASRSNEIVVLSNIEKAQRYVLLSDQSQVSENYVDFNMQDGDGKVLEAIMLTEIVRCPRRILNAAKPFEVSSTNSTEENDAEHATCNGSRCKH